jgi:hypothetical protein
MTKSNAEAGTDVQTTESDVDRFLRETHDLANHLLSLHTKLYELLKMAKEIQASRR